MLYIFDLDGTLISAYMENIDKDYHRWQVLPNRGEKVHQLLTEGHSIAIVTNQAGVAFAKITEADWERKIHEVKVAFGVDGYQSVEVGAAGGLGMEEANKRSARFANQFAVFVCFADSRSPIAAYRTPIQVNRRKPSPRMLMEAKAHFADAAAIGTLMIGDRGEDREAAARADVPFIHARDFFAMPPENE